MGDYNVLRNLTADSEVESTRLPLLVRVHIQEPEAVSGQTPGGHVDPPALHLQLFCHFPPARGPSEDTRKEAIQDFPRLMGPKGRQR